MGKPGRIDLREFQFPLWQEAENFLRNGGSNARRASIDEFCDLGHEGNLCNATAMESEICDGILLKH
jgi:hypothetical protein